MPIHSPQKRRDPADPTSTALGYAVAGGRSAPSSPVRTARCRRSSGDGAFLMTCMEILTAASKQSRAWSITSSMRGEPGADRGRRRAIPYKPQALHAARKTQHRGRGGWRRAAAFLPMNDNTAIADVIGKANAIAKRGQACSSSRSGSTIPSAPHSRSAAVKTNFGRFPAERKIAFF